VGFRIVQRTSMYITGPSVICRSTEYKFVQYSSVWFGKIQRGRDWYNTAQYGLCNTVHYILVQCRELAHRDVHYSLVE
jgi:hypothetical protein